MNTTTRETKVCLVCATTGKFRWLPCPTHSEEVGADCLHNNTSRLILENGGDLILCHRCGATNEEEN